MAVGLLLSNYEVLAALKLVDSALVAAVLEQRMQAETSSQSMKLVVAGAAARAGSRRAALFLLESLERTDRSIASDTQHVLGRLLRDLGPNPPTWAVELAQIALADDRLATGPEIAPDERLRLSELALEDARLALALADAKAAAAVPFLLQLEHVSSCDPSVLLALAKLADRAAAPRLLQCLKDGLANQVPFDREGGRLSAPASIAIDGLAAMAVAEAVPVLLEHIELVAVIDGLDRNGDARAREPLEALLSAGGRIWRGDEEILPKLAAKRLVAAKIALVRLASSSPAGGYCALLADTSFDEHERVTVVERMHALRDPAVIPCLARALQSDASGQAAGAAIEALRDFPHVTAVEALIAGLDADFEGKHYSRRLWTPAMFRDAIAAELTKLTGESFGPSSKPWSTWWKHTGRKAFVDRSKSASQATSQPPRAPGTLTGSSSTANRIDSRTLQ